MFHETIFHCRRGSMLLDCDIVVGERSEYFDGPTSVGKEKITDAIRPNRINKRLSAKDHALSVVARNIRYVFCRFENVFFPRYYDYRTVWYSPAVVRGDKTRGRRIRFRERVVVGRLTPRKSFGCVHLDYIYGRPKSRRPRR